MPCSFVARIVASVAAEPSSHTEKGTGNGAAADHSSKPCTGRSAKASAAAAGIADHSTLPPAERSANLGAASSSPPPQAHTTANRQRRNHAFIEAHVLCGAEKSKARFLADSGAETSIITPELLRECNPQGLCTIDKGDITQIHLADGATVVKALGTANLWLEIIFEGDASPRDFKPLREPEKSCHFTHQSRW